MSVPVNVSAEGSVGIIELARPDKFNCLSLEIHECISRARESFEADGDIRSILICAQGKHFCTGADLTEVKGKMSDAQALDHFIAFGMEGLRRLEQSRLPVVVAVQGLCLAGGLELMLSCDVCFAAESAQFGDQHAQFGLIPGWGGSQRLTRLMGLRRARPDVLGPLAEGGRGEGGRTGELRRAGPRAAPGGVELLRDHRHPLTPRHCRDEAPGT